MDRSSTIAWIDEVARDTALLGASAPGSVVAVRVAVSPTCGDEVRFGLHLGGHGDVHLRGSVRGCVLSTASTAVAVAAIENQTPAQAVQAIATALDQRLTGGKTSSTTGDLSRLSTLELVPLRRRCVAFPWQILVGLLEEVSTEGRPGSGHRSRGSTTRRSPAGRPDA